MACHLSALVLLTRLPLGNVWGPLVVWLLRRNAAPTVDQHGREALNFQLTMTLVFVALSLLAFGFGKLPGTLHHAEGVMWVCMRAWELTNLWFIIKAAFKVGQNEPFKYPFAWRIIPA